jgi:hypothetical protein
MFGHKRVNLHQQYDEQLVDLIHETKASWDHAKETQEAVYESNISSELAQHTKLQEQKYIYLYKEAKRRQARG